MRGLEREIKEKMKEKREIIKNEVRSVEKRIVGVGLDESSAPIALCECENMNPAMAMATAGCNDGTTDGSRNRQFP